MKLAEKVIKKISEMSLSPITFVTRLRSDCIEPAFKTYFTQYLVDKYKLQQHVKNHNWSKEAIRLLKVSKIIYNKKVSFKKSSKKEKFKEAIDDVVPEALAKKAKDYLLNILVRNKNVTFDIMRPLERFDTTNKEVKNIYINFLKDNLPKELSELVDM